MITLAHRWPYRFFVRVLYLAGLLLALHAVLFALFCVLPSGLGTMFGWGSLDAGFRSAMENSLGVGGNWLDQYRSHLRSLLQLDLGRSLRGQFPVAPALLASALTSLPLFVAVIIGGFTGPLTALWAYVPQRSRGSAKVGPLCAGAVNLPPFIIAAAAYAIYQAANRGGGFAAQVWALWVFALFASALFPFLVTFAIAARVCASLMELPFFRALRAMGLSRSQLRWSILPMLLAAVRPAMARVAIGGILSTAFVEWLFGIPGFGRLGLHALQDSDFALMFGWVFLATLVVLVLSEVEQWPVRRA